MKKYIIFMLVFASTLVSQAEGFESKRRSNPNYKNLKIYAKVLHRYGKSNYYQMQIDIVNTGNKSVSFWLDVNSYIWTFRFWAGGVWFVEKRERECFVKGIPYKRYDHEIYRSVRIFPHAKYSIKADFLITNRNIFLSNNQNLRLTFHFNDANLHFKEDPTRPKIESNIITYDW